MSRFGLLNSSVLMRVVLAVLAIGCTPWLVGCHREPAAAAVPAAEPKFDGETVEFTSQSAQLSNLKVAAVNAAQQQGVRIQGRLAWDETRSTRVDAPVAGRIEAVNANLGEAVRAGQVLARVASPDIAQAHADSRRAATDLQAAHRQLARARELHGAGVTPLKELQAAEAELARAASEHTRALAREKLLGVVGRNGEAYELRAPIAGTVVERHATLGLEVRPDQAQPSGPPLFLLADPTKLWALLDVPESLAASVRKGQHIELSTPAIANRTIAAEIDYVADALDANSRVLKARANVDNPDRALKAEMFVAGELSLPQDAAVLVPASALFLIGEQYYAFVEVTTGRFTRRAVRAREAGLGTMRVNEGLAAGDRVVVEGALLLQQLLSNRAK